MTKGKNRIHHTSFNKKRIRRLMRALGLRSVCRKKRYHYTPSTIDPFDEAVERNPDAHPLFHSDRGFQYASKAFRKKPDASKMTQSMSRAGRCIDNGPMEGFWGILKSEMYYLRKSTDGRELTAAEKALPYAEYCYKDMVSILSAVPR